jgi:uncharacterized cupin superfamily protein
MEQKHPNIANIDDVEARVETKADKFGFTAKRLGPLVGARTLGASYFEIHPGRQAFPHHFHTANEEAVFVLEGQGLVRIGQEEIEIKAGDYVAFPVGPDHAHSVRNPTDQPLKLLAISTLQPVEVIGYPDSKKTAAFALPDASKGFKSGASPWVRMLVKDQPPVDYYEGEI